MTDIVHTHGRRMSRLLEQALDSFTAEERDYATYVFDEAAKESTYPHMRRLFDALAIELRLSGLRLQMDADECDAIARATSEARIREIEGADGTLRETTDAEGPSEFRSGE